MQDNRTTDAENVTSTIDPEDWQLALQSYEEDPENALSLAFLLTEVSQLIRALKMYEALEELEIAIDCLYEHSSFRNVSRDLFERVIEGKITTSKEALLRELGIQF
jgi:hypothetical protein